MKIQIVITFQAPEREEAHRLANEFENFLGKPSFKLVQVNEIRLRWERR